MKPKLIFGKQGSAVLIALFALSFSALGQASIPNGTTVPVWLDSSISLNSKPGAKITARVMQDVPLANHERIPSGARLVGHVIAVNSPHPNGGARVSFEFDQLISGHRTIPLRAALSALASFFEVDQAQIPDTGLDRGTPESAWTTTQIGGDSVYHGGGPVTEGSNVVGRPTPHGVLVNAGYPAGLSCGGVNTSVPRAVWLFSADACGTYGFTGLSIARSGGSDPAGQIVLISTRHKISIPAGSAMLLTTVRKGTPDASNHS